MLIRKNFFKVISGFLVLFMACGPTFAMRAPASSETPTAAGIEQFLKAGVEQISIFIEPTLREGALVGRPEPYRPSRKIDPSKDTELWSDTTIRQAEWVVLTGVKTAEGKAKDSRGKAVIQLKGLGGKPIVTTGDYAKAYNQEVMVKVRPDQNGAPPQVLAVYNGAREIIEGVKVYVDTGDLKITGGGPKKEEPYAFLTDDVGTALWKDPRINNATVQRVFLRGIPAYSSRGWAAFRIGEEAEVVTIGRYSTLHNRTVMAEMGRNPEAPMEWIVTRVFNGARENISPTFAGSDIRVYLDIAPASGSVPSGSRSTMTTSLLGPTFWGNMEVQLSENVLLDGVPMADFNGVAGVKVGQRQIVLTDLPYDPDSGMRLLIHAHPGAQQGLPIVESVFDGLSRKVYPARQILISVDPLISNGRIESAVSRFWLDADKVDAGQFWNLTEIKSAHRVAWSGAPIEEANGYASVRVGDSRYRADAPFPSLEGDRLLIVAKPDSRELAAAYRLLNGERVFFHKAAGLEATDDVLEAMAADLKSELSQLPFTDQAVKIDGVERALIVMPDGLYKLSAAPMFLVPGQKQFRIEALVTSEKQREKVRRSLKALGFTDYRVYTTQQFGGEREARITLQDQLSREQIQVTVVDAVSGLETVAQFLGTPYGESAIRALDGTADRYRSLWL